MVLIWEGAEFWLEGDVFTEETCSYCNIVLLVPVRILSKPYYAMHSLHSTATNV